MTIAINMILISVFAVVVLVFGSVFATSGAPLDRGMELRGRNMISMQVDNWVWKIEFIRALLKSYILLQSRNVCICIILEGSVNRYDPYCLLSIPSFYTYGNVLWEVRSMQILNFIFLYPSENGSEGRIKRYLRWYIEK